MQVQDFLSTVLPQSSEGYYCAVELTTNRREHKFVQTVEELVDAVRAFDDAGKETYFALASFATGASRTAANAVALRALFADLDCGEGKPYADAAGAVGAVGEWLAATGFPKPYMVSSGYGIHCYWPFTAAIPVGMWRPLAESFKRACTAHGLHIDYTVSADAARVLRVPETRNRKHGGNKKVRVAIVGDAPCPVEDYAELLADWKETKPALVEVKPNLDPFLDAAPVYAKGGSSYKTDIAEIFESSFNKIVTLGDDGCKQIMRYITNATEEGSEPLFRAVISIAKHCTEGYEAAQELGALHPYTESRIARKYEAILGPHNCSTFDKTVANVCPGCKHWGKITNPIILGRELKKDPAPIEAIAHTSTGAVPKAVEFPAAPQGFSVRDSGVYIVFADAEGVQRTSPVADTPFFATGTYDRTGERFVQFTYKEHGEAKSAVLPLAIVTTKDEVFKAFAKIGVMVPTGGENGFRAYVKATIAEAKKRPPLIMPTSLGWQADDSFAFDSRIFSKDGERVVPMHGFDNINETTGTRGTLDGWRLVVAGVMRLERWDILSMMAISFGAPLMRFTGLNGVTFHLCSNDSGRGKTLCQRLASSVWGVPDKFRTTPNTSPLAMVNRLGMLGSLPLFVDEITHKGRAETEWFPEFLSQMSDGRGKDRMESQTNAERRNTTTWATMALMTSNKHMLDYLTAERSHGSEGEIRRLVEITFDRELNMDELTKSLLFDHLPNNYGTPGEAYAKWMVNNVPIVQQIVKSTYAEVFKNFGASGDERFWIAGCACILAGVRLAGRQYANVIDMPVGKIAAYLYDVIKNMRVETGRMKRTAVDVLNEFTKRNYGKLVTVNDRIAKISGIEVAETLDRRDLCGRVEKGATDGWIDYFIEERELKSFCSSLSYGYTEFKRDLSTLVPVAYTRRDLLAGTKGPTLVVRCIHIRQRTDAVFDIFGDKAANE